jgi:VWFA-related protein
MRLALLALSLVALVAQDQRPVFRAQVSAVRLDVLVRDGNRPVAGLTSSDFEVTDNGVRQAVEAVQAADTPLDVVFVLDRSQSVAGETLSRLKEAVGATTAGLRPADRAALLTFAHDVSLDSPFEADRAAFAAAVSRVTAGGATSALDAVYGALLVAEGSGRRTLVLLFSDGFDNRSWLTAGDIVRTARESEAVICGVAFVLPTLARGDRPPHVELLRTLSGATGGELVAIDRGADLAPTFVRILDTMRARYLLTYTPAGAETRGWHELKVRLTGARGTVVARPGYFVR